ncbi:MAG: cytochrome c oxidase subunit II [Neomegalonema sp.]|nr:cytochrome c oxidase subunit II [Neomegalonema sp.]
MIKSMIRVKAPKLATLAVAFLATALAFGGAIAQEFGVPVPGGLDLQPPASEVAIDQQALHHQMLYIITGITVFVLALLLIVILRYNSAVNKTPARFTHNSLIEAIWTIAPVIILIVIAVPSVKLLLKQEDFSKVKPDVVIKATGWQWQWQYEYPELGVQPYFSKMIGYLEPVMNAKVEAELAKHGYPKDMWKLATDTAVIVPVGKTVVVRVTGFDVIHSWSVDSLGVKADGVPSRTNELWFKATREGVFTGQCKELCGTNHSYMPIVVKVVSEETFATWAACAKEKGAENCKEPTMLEMMAKAKGGAKKEVKTAKAAAAAVER